jgi:hypothetical protein
MSDIASVATESERSDHTQRISGPIANCADLPGRRSVDHIPGISDAALLIAKSAIRTLIESSSLSARTTSWRP